MDDVLIDFATAVSLDTYTKTTVDFVETLVKVSEPILAVVQPAQRDTLQAMQVDLTIRHIQVHAAENITVGQYIEYMGDNYKIITPGDFQLYGFSDVIGAEVKGAIT